MAIVVESHPLPVSVPHSLTSLLQARIVFSAEPGTIWEIRRLLSNLVRVYEIGVGEGSLKDGYATELEITFQGLNCC